MVFGHDGNVCAQYSWQLVILLKKKYLCPFCDYRASSKQSLILHQKIHGRHFICHLCLRDSSGSGAVRFEDMSEVRGHFAQVHTHIAKIRIRDFVDLRFETSVPNMNSAPPKMTTPPPISRRMEHNTRPQNHGNLTSRTNRFPIFDHQQIADICNQKFGEFKDRELTTLSEGQKVEIDSLKMNVASIESTLKQRKVQLAKSALNLRMMEGFLQDMREVFLRPLHANLFRGNLNDDPSTPTVTPSPGAQQAKQPCSNSGEAEGTPVKKPRI